VTASDRLDELRKRYDENPRRFFASLANEYRKAGDLEQAIALCQTHLAEQPANMNGHVVYGQALFEAGRFDEAKVTFEAALTLDSENLIALRHLGDIACAYGANDEARQWYGRVLDSDPRNHEIIALLEQLAKESRKAGPVAPVAMGERVEQPQAPAVEAPAEPPASLPPLSERVELMDLPDDFESSPESLVWIDPLVPAEGAAAIELPSFDDGSGGAPLDAAALTSDVFGEFMPDPFAQPATGESAAWEPQAVEAAQPADETPGAPAEPAPPFVTETMAELYLQQGFNAEALEVYRRLLRENPDDEQLKQRVRKLARGDRDSIPFDLVPGPETARDQAQAQVQSHAQAPEAVSAPRPNARSYFAGLAARRAVRGNGSARPAPESAPAIPARDEIVPASSAPATLSLDRLFQDGAVSPGDEHSAQLLAQVAEPAIADAAALAERPAESGPSLDAIFRDAGERVTPTVPRQSQTLRFDQFFSTAADEASVSPQPPASSASSAPSGEPGSPAELKQFRSWLLGLKKQ
jgi:tetratricopeptide (TPR) repeat protein